MVTQVGDIIAFVIILTGRLLYSKTILLSERFLETIMRYTNT